MSANPWGPEFSGFKGRLKLFGIHAKKKHNWPFLLGGVIGLAGYAAMDYGITEEQRKQSVFTNRAEIMEKRKADKVRKAGGYDGLAHH
mmetsp:Transcript_670/g.1301  ORF Transcript_670/g.1301 Transcript_670/m.1301 type:complete len:88 (-) Transcript_670:157-420(-)